MESHYATVKPYPEVTDQLLLQVVDRTLAVGQPAKIVLFGSRARNDHKPDSDLDILIIESSEEAAIQRRSAYEDSLKGAYPEVTVIVKSLPEVEKWKFVPSQILTTALREGKVLYEHPEWERYSALVVAESSEHYTPADLAKQWFDKGDEDLKLAQLGLDHDGPYALLCFHAQQAVEKYLKSYLALHNVTITKTHDLDSLVVEINRFCSALELTNMALKIMTGYAISGRYDLHFDPDREEVDEALQIARQVREILKRLSLP